MTLKVTGADGSVSDDKSISPSLTVNCRAANGRCLESLVQCAAVNTCEKVLVSYLHGKHSGKEFTYLDPINDPPHQNSVRFGPCKKIAAS